MEISKAHPEEKMEWNQFVKTHYPPVGAFMQTWEWGTFQEKLGKRAERYFVAESHEPVAAFTLVHHTLPFGFSYGYVPRGPVIATRAREGGKPNGVFGAIRAWAAQRFPHFIFVRLEPPLSSLGHELYGNGFFLPPYYVQPRHNLAVPLEQSEEEILAGFHPTTRSNIRRAEKRGVSVVLKRGIAEHEYGEFFAMVRDTIRRNSGKNAYPSRSYFRSLIETIFPAEDIHDPHTLSLGIFCGYEHGVPASTHFVLFFGDTATYLYGASYTRTLGSKVTTHLHWAAMREAKRRGMRFYDLGGIDEKLWPTLTNFKRQFRGKEYSYMGNLDIPIRPALYHAYNILRGMKQSVVQ